MDDLVEKVAERISNTGINGGDPLLEFIVASFAELGVGMYEGIENDAAKDIEALAKAALSAIQDTHAIVPLEPTEAMVIGAVVSLKGNLHNPMQNLGDIKAIYKAMIEASPHFPTSNPSTSPTK